MKEKRQSLLSALAIASFFAVFLATRLYRLDIVPFGAHRMHIDEVGAAYDAFCLSEYGVDQFLLRFPVYFRCFGEGQNALYTYLALIIFKIGGISIFNFRLTAVICASGAFVALYFLVKNMMDRCSAIIALALMTVMPVFMMSEHWGLECYLMMSFVIISMCFLVQAVLSGKSIFYFLAGVLWGITLYTYSMSYIVVPVFLALTFFVLFAYKKIDLKKTLLTGIPLVLLGIPLLMEQLVTMGYLEPFAFLGISDLWVPEYTRYHSFSLENVSKNILTGFKYIYVADNDSYDANPVFGTMYYISIPLILIGMVTSAIAVVRDIKAKIFNPWILNWILYIVSRLFFLLLETPYINRVNCIYPAYLLFIVYGIRAAGDKIKWKKIFYGIVCAAYLVSFVAFSKYFYTGSGLQRDAFNMGDGLGVDVQAGEAAALAKKIANGRPVVAMLNDGYYRDMALALFTETSPYDFQRDHEPKDRSFNGVEWAMPDGLDLSGDTVYLIDVELLHITQYLQSEGFAVDITYPDFTVVYR